MRVLVVNAGSSNLKLRLLDHDDTLLGSADLTTDRRDGDAVRKAVARLPEPDAVGHRVVHGGPDFTGPVRIGPRVRDRLADLVALAPLHQPESLAGIDLVDDALPGIPAVACFDTAFHAGLPAVATTYALPAEWRDRFRLKRYGFHGLSHAYAARHAARTVGNARARVVVAHLGAGASLAAVRGADSVDTTMGFTPVEGLVMATRSGDVDPGMLMWLQRQAWLTADEIADALQHRSGLRGLAGSGDMREVLAAAQRGDPDARLAIEVYVHRLRAKIAAMAASLGGVDVLVFTGGVGEHAAPVRARAADGLAFLGIAIDADANAAADSDTDITAPGARVRTLITTAREDLEIAAGVRSVLTEPSS